MPGLPALATGFEYTRFAPACCGNPQWYSHWEFPGTWTARDLPLAHPLGGNGTEWLGYLHATPAAARVRLEAAGFLRSRGAENLYSPGRRGHSHGVTGQAAWRALPRLDVLLGGQREVAGGWRWNRFELAGKAYFGG